MTVELHSIVFHSHYGKGKVIKVKDANVYIGFGEKLRIFPYPEAFERGYLTIENDKREEREVVISVSDNISYKKIYEIINATVGTDYSGWMKAVWPPKETPSQFRLWFPKLAETKNGELVSAAFDCVNTISEDWNEVVFDDLKDTPESINRLPFEGITLIFAKEPKGGPYLFRGAYINDAEKTRSRHLVSMRIGTKVKLIGKPSNRIEVLDDFRNNNRDE